MCKAELSLRFFFINSYNVSMEWVILGIVIAIFLVVSTYFWTVMITFRILFRRPITPKKLVFPKPFFGGVFDKHIKEIEENHQKNAKLPCEEIYISSSAGRLKGRYFENATSNKVIVFIHGYYSSGMRDVGYFGSLYSDLGVSLLVIDQRATGESEGVYTSLGALERFDVREWIFYLNSRFKGEKDIYLHGISMGAATSLLVTALAALPPSFKGVIADCGFSRTNGVIFFAGKRMLKIKPRLTFWGLNVIARLAGGFNLNNVNVSRELHKNTKIPILFFHGTADLFVPYNMSVKNFKATSSKKRLVAFPGAGHCESYLSNKELYTEEMRKFIYGKRKVHKAPANN
ncbi:MAG: Alpha/beta hydrolase family protein [Tenericutes bacterium ADurb.Bin087]|nr:MAG: Alpha/beta hydrolase family protein [Tenericutes bacterium ADurb.Bin087]